MSNKCVKGCNQQNPENRKFYSINDPISSTSKLKKKKESKNMRKGIYKLRDISFDRLYYSQYLLPSPVRVTLPFFPSDISFGHVIFFDK